MVNLNRRLIMNCARISRPLTRQTKKSLQQLKQVLCTAPLLRTFDPQFPIVVTTDASGFAIGAVIEQDDDMFRRPVAYFSRAMNPHEQNYHAQEQELLAIVEAPFIGVPP
jgi:hypothetical protein